MEQHLGNRSYSVTAGLALSAMGIWDDQVGPETFPAALAQTGPLGQLLEWLRGRPAGLPDAVLRSILNQPSYADGQQIPGPRNPLMEQELGAFSGPQRGDALTAALGRGRMFREGGYPLPDMIPDAWLRGNDYGYPSPQRYPWALY